VDGAVIERVSGPPCRGAQELQEFSPEMIHSPRANPTATAREWLLLAGMATAAALTASTTAAQTVDRVSVSSAGTQAQPTDGGIDDGSTCQGISDDGRYIVFCSVAPNLIEGRTITGRQVYLRDRVLDTTVLVSGVAGTPGDDASGPARISGDGSAVVFESLATNLVAGDTNAAADVFVWERQTGAITRVSVSSAGTQAGAASADVLGPVISADGRYVAFASNAGDLAPGGMAGTTQIYRHDRQTGTTIRISTSTEGLTGDRVSSGPDISGDGDTVAFRSASRNLVPGDTNLVSDIFLRRVSAGATTRVSLTAAGGQITGSSSNATINRAGTLVAFTSFADVTGQATALANVYVRDLTAESTVRLTQPLPGAGGGAVVGGAARPAFSGNGRFIAVSTTDNTLYPGDDNGAADVLLYDLQSAPAVPLRLSFGLGGTGPAPGPGALPDDAPWCDNSSAHPSLSFDGLVTAFDSLATNLVAGDTNGVHDVFITVRTAPPPPPPACLADITADGTVDGDDFIAFINSFAIGDASVDAAADVIADGTIDGTDFIEFINAFSAGC
jgi:Tol biopolymer transport system component